MSHISKILGYLFLLFLISHQVIAQPGAPAKKISQPITIERLKSAVIVENLLDSFPAELEIVSCMISIAGKDIKYTETKLPDHNLPDIFGGVHAGHKIFVEYVRVGKPGSKAQPFMYPPRELVVTD